MVAENPLHTSKSGLDALLLAIDDDWRGSFRGMIESLSAQRPPFFVVGPSADMELLRAAMRAGARDVFSMPLNVEDFVAAVTRVADEERARGGAPSAHLVAFMNTKGGSGASFLAANTALVVAALKQRRTILIDLDFQFGGLPTYLNMAARNGLIKALELVDGLDEASLQGYAQKHESGLHLLAAAMDEIILPEDVSRERIERLLSVLDGIYEDVVVDLPRRIDVPTATVLSRAEKVVLVSSTDGCASPRHQASRLPAARSARTSCRPHTPPSESFRQESRGTAARLCKPLAGPRYWNDSR